MKYFSAFLLLIAFLFSTSANAEVLESNPNGFKIVQKYEINVNSKKIFRALINPKFWWSSSHTWSKDAKNLYIEPYANGCFCEKLNNNGSVLHMKIVYFEPNNEIRMFGALGPMQFSGATGHLIMKIVEKNNISNLEISFYGGGYFPGGLDKLAPMADKMLSEQFINLKKYAEKIK